VVRALSAKMVTFLDLTMPTWRIQAAGAEDLIGVRGQGHPGPGRATRWRADPAPGGFIFEFETRTSRQSTHGRDG
jgi:hypothetical protein